MTTLPKLTKNELNTLSEAHKKMLSDKPEGQAVTLDPANELHKELILTALKTAGQTPEKYPYLYSKIKKGGTSNKVEPDKMIIVDAGADSNGKATARTWLANNKGTLYSGASLVVLDGDTDKLLAFGSNTDVHSGFMQNHTDTQTAKKVNKSIRVLGVNHMVGHDGAVQFTAIAGDRHV